MTKSLQNKLKKWREGHADNYAHTLLDAPATTSVLKCLPKLGVILIMGDLGMGKSAEAHCIAETLHKSYGMPAVIHLPVIPDKFKNRIQALLPRWCRVVTDRKLWPTNGIIIIDEAAQQAHARRTQSKEAVELDNLLSIARQRGQLIIFISHHSRKLDPNIVQQVTQIHWKQPSFAHQLFERDEMQDFSMRAFDFFQEVRKGRPWKQCTEAMQRLVKSTTLVLDMQDFRFVTFKNKVAEYWTENLSCIFKDLTEMQKAGDKS